METHYLTISWNQYYFLSQRLAETILSYPTTHQEIIAISRGGLTLGHLLSDLLRMPIFTIAIQSYTDIQSQGEIKIIGRLQSRIKGKRILVVDDVSDSGKTLVRAMAYLKRFHPKDISTVTMFYKPHSVFRPDFFAQVTKKWILFPYEPTEMIMLISKKLSQEGKSKTEIQLFLEKLHYSPDQIRFVRKYHLDSQKSI